MAFEIKYDYVKKHCFSIEGSKVYIFSDIPHDIKLLRNHLMDSGLHIPSLETSIGKFDYQTLVAREHAELRMSSVTKQHIEVVGQDRQNVRMAAQLFTTKTIQAFKTQGSFLANFLRINRCSTSPMTPIIFRTLLHGVLSNSSNFCLSMHSSVYPFVLVLISSLCVTTSRPKLLNRINSYFQGMFPETPSCASIHYFFNMSVHLSVS